MKSASVCDNTFFKIWFKKQTCTSFPQKTKFTTKCFYLTPKRSHFDSVIRPHPFVTWPLSSIGSSWCVFWLRFWFLLHLQWFFLVWIGSKGKLALRSQIKTNKIVTMRRNIEEIFLRRRFWTGTRTRRQKKRVVPVLWRFPPSWTEAFQMSVFLIFVTVFGTQRTLCECDCVYLLLFLLLICLWFLC